MARKSGNKRRKAVKNDTRRYVVLRLWGKDLDPGEITRKLQIEPTAGHARGPALDVNGKTVKDPATGKLIKWPSGVWTLNSYVPNAKIETQMKRILEQIRPRRNALRRIVAAAHAAIVISIEPAEGFANVTYTLPADLVNEFTSLGIDVEFSFWLPGWYKTEGKENAEKT